MSKPDLKPTAASPPPPGGPGLGREVDRRRKAWRIALLGVLLGAGAGAAAFFQHGAGGEGNSPHAGPVRTMAALGTSRAPKGPSGAAPHNASHEAGFAGGGFQGVGRPQDDPLAPPRGDELAADLAEGPTPDTANSDATQPATDGEDGLVVAAQGQGFGLPFGFGLGGGPGGGPGGGVGVGAGGGGGPSNPGPGPGQPGGPGAPSSPPGPTGPGAPPSTGPSAPGTPPPPISVPSAPKGGPPGVGAPGGSGGSGDQGGPPTGGFGSPGGGLDGGGGSPGPGNGGPGIPGVPEPATWLLMTLGVGMTGAALRRKRSQSAA